MTLADFAPLRTFCVVSQPTRLSEPSALVTCPELADILEEVLRATAATDDGTDEDSEPDEVSHTAGISVAWCVS